MGGSGSDGLKKCPPPSLQSSNSWMSVKENPDKTKKERFNLLLYVQSFIQDKENVTYVYANINCNLKIRFSDYDEKIFSSKGELESIPRKLLSLFFLKWFLASIISSYHLLLFISIIVSLSIIWNFIIVIDQLSSFRLQNLAF